MGLSRREYAEHRGCSSSLVQKRVSQGVLKRSILGDGSIDAEVADREWGKGSASMASAVEAKKKAEPRKRPAMKAKKRAAAPEQVVELDDEPCEALVPDSSRRAVRESLKEAAQKVGGGKVLPCWPSWRSAPSSVEARRRTV